MPNISYNRPLVSERWTHNYSNGSSPEVILQYSRTSISNTDFRNTSDNLPGWRQKIARGQSATTTLSGRRTFWKIESGLIHYVRFDPTFPASARYVRFFKSGEFVGTSPQTDPASLSETEANNKALSLLVSRARERQTKFLGGVFLGELGEALRMIRHPAAALRRGLDDYLGAVKERTRRLKNHPRRRIAADTWLEYSFGWSPLIRDIEDGRKAVRQILSRSNQDLARVEAVGVTESSTSPSSFSDASGAISWRVSSYSVSRVIVKYYGAVYVRSGSPSSDALRTVGFSWQSFIPTAWELIPYSFLVDYFTNIGEILSAGSYSRSNFAWVNKTVIKEWLTYRHSISVAWPSGGPGSVVLASRYEPCKSLATSRRVSRSPYTGSLIPDLEFQIPGIGSLKWINLSALALRHKSLLPFW